MFTLTKTKKLDYFQAQGVDSQSNYAILNSAISLEGLTRAEAERIFELPARTALAYMGGTLSLANNLNQSVILKSWKIRPLLFSREMPTT